MPPPLKLTTESFIFKNSPYKRTTNVNTHKKKKKAAAAAATTKGSRPQHRLKAAPVTQSEHQQQQQQRALVSTGQVAHVLQGRCIYIEKKLHDYTRLKELADAMGASVKDSMDKTVTDYITDLKSGKKQLGATAHKGNRCVSPLWLFTCYEQQRYLPPINFPIDLQPHINTFPAAAPLLISTAAASATTTTTTTTITTTSSNPTSNNNNMNNNIVDDDDNPFGIEEVDYDLLETRKPGYQFKMDGYLTRNRGSEENDVVSSDAETVRLQDEEQEQEQEEEEEENDDDAGQREFYYNHSNDISSNTARKRREESAEEIEARNKRNNEIRLKLSKAKSSATTSSNGHSRSGNSSRIVTRSSSSSSSQKEVSTGFFGQQKFSVWYGEQEFEHVTSNKRS